MAADGVQGLARGEVVLDEPTLEAARFGLAKAWPRRSARTRVTLPQALGLAALALAACAIGYWRPDWLARSVHFALFTIFAACAVLRLTSALAMALPERAPKRQWRGPLPVYTVLCPMFQEAGQIPRLIAALECLDYPREALDVKLLLEADDAATLAAARAAKLPPWIELIVLAPCKPRTKPKALNAGLTHARGRFITVYDAEDAPAPSQLRDALDAFASGGADLACVQAPLLIDNGKNSWIAQQFALEYAVQFLGQASLLSRLELPFPLGGSSNHFRTEGLRAAGGWDAFNVTEDADVGFRLARDGWRFAVLQAPTFEEAPVRLGAWLRQRSRWIKGHLQTWLVLMRDPLGALRELGFAGFVAMQATMAGTVFSAFCGAPAALALLTTLIVSPSRLSVWDGGLAGFALFSAMCAGLAAAAKQNKPALAVALFSVPIYWCLAFPAACLALYELVLRPFYWAKTQHGEGARTQSLPLGT